MPKTETPPAATLPDDITTAISARLFAAVAPFRAVADIRYYLCGLHLLPNPVGPGVYLVATDGHQLAIALDIEGRTPKAQILTVGAGLASAARAARHKDGAKVVLQGDRLRVMSGLLEERHVQPGPASIDHGQYPDVLRVLQTNTASLRTGLHGSFSSKLIERLNKVATDLSTRYSKPLTHWTDSAGRLYTRFAAEPELLCLSMPMLGEDALQSPIPLLLQNAITQHHENAARAAEREAALKTAAATTVNRDAETATAA